MINVGCQFVGEIKPELRERAREALAVLLRRVVCWTRDGILSRSELHTVMYDDGEKKKQCLKEEWGWEGRR